MTATQKASRRQTKFLHWGLFSLFAALLILLSLPLFGRMTDNARRTQTVGYIKHVLLACRAYSADHEGRYPDSLDELIPEYIESDVEFLLFQKLGSSRKPLIYFPGFTENSPSRTPIIVSPIPLEGMIAVGYAGGHVTEEKSGTIELPETN